MLILRRDEFGEIGNFGWTHVLLLLLMGELHTGEESEIQFICQLAYRLLIRTINLKISLRSRITLGVAFRNSARIF